MWIEIEEWRPEINLYKTLFSGHISPDVSGKEKDSSWATFKIEKYATEKMIKSGTNVLNWHK